MDGPAHLLLSADGDVLGVTDTLDQAVTIARQLAPAENIYIDGPEEPADEAMAANPRAQRPLLTAPEDSLRAVQVAVGRVSVFNYRVAYGMDLTEAHARLQPLFPRSKGANRPIHAYDRPVSMASSILSANYKTSKKTPQHIIATLETATGFRRANVLGLSMLPNVMSYANSNVQTLLQRATTDYKMAKRPPTRLNSCVRATPACIASCLVFSGFNPINEYNTVRKYAMAQALVHEPDAFLRMLIEAIRIHRHASFADNKMPLVRLNVFSDLPWELLAPDLFEEFRDVQFYDYTKVPNRRPPPNYDLTFSFAGTDENVAYMDYEIMTLRRRVAVVFAAVGLSALRDIETPRVPAFYRRKPGQARKARHYARLPNEFLGLPLIDGDESDMRPYDPAPCFVGLRWKTPLGQSIAWDQAQVFVVRVHLVRDKGGYYNAIVSKTPRFDGIDYTDA